MPASTTAFRIFTFEGQVVAYRKADGYAGVVFQPPGYQGTSLVQTQGSGSATGVAVRRLTPFGAPRGTTAGTWELGRGFLGGTSPTAVTDPGTGLVHLGAREYDPALGRFLSVDPLMDLNDPTQFNAYGYSDNNPITMSDPAGTRPLGRSDTDAVDMVTTGGNVRPGYTSSPVQSTIEDSNQRATAGMTPHERKEYQAEEQPRVEQEVVHAEKAAYWELESRSQAVAAHRALAIVNVVVPYQDTIDCFQGQGVGSCASAAMVVLPVKGGGAAAKFGLKTFLETGGRPAVRGVEAAAKGGAAAVRMGQAGEAAVRSMYDIGPKATRVIGAGRESSTG